MRLGQLPACTRAADSSALLRIVLILICPLLPLGTVPVEALVLCVARGPLSSPPPTCCSLFVLNLYPPWARFLAVLSFLCFWGSLPYVADPCFSQEAQPQECAGSLEPPSLGPGAVRREFHAQ